MSGVRARRLLLLVTTRTAMSTCPPRFGDRGAPPHIRRRSRRRPPRPPSSPRCRRPPAVAPSASCAASMCSGACSRSAPYATPGRLRRRVGTVAPLRGGSVVEDERLEGVQVHRTQLARYAREEAEHVVGALVLGRPSRADRSTWYRRAARSARVLLDLHTSRALRLVTLVQARRGDHLEHLGCG